MPGFQVVEARMAKLGIRGTATAKLAFNNMLVPQENILGPPGKGLKVALTVLDFGRTTSAPAAPARRRRACGWRRNTPARAASSAARSASSNWSRRSSPAWPPGPTRWKR